MRKYLEITIKTFILLNVILLGFALLGSFLELDIRILTDLFTERLDFLMKTERFFVLISLLTKPFYNLIKYITIV